MKASENHRRALDCLQTSIASAIDSANRVKKTVTRYVQWLHNCRKLLRRIAQCSSSCSNSDPHLHPQILGAQNAAFRFLDSGCAKFDPLLERVWIPKAQTVNDAAAKKLDEHIARLRRISQALQTLYEHFMGQIHRPAECATTEAALETGFSHHCMYMRYFHELGELETRFDQGMADLTKTISDMNHFLNQSASQVNQFFVKRFGKAITGDSAGGLAVDQADALTATRMVVASSLSTFNQPSFAPATLYQFSDVPMKLVAKASYEGMCAGETSVDADEVVDALDTSGAEYWMIKKADGQEGLVAAAALRPLPAGPGTKRASVMPGAGPPPMSLRD
jgi:hypothetical protein